MARDLSSFHGFQLLGVLAILRVGIFLRVYFGRMITDACYFASLWSVTFIRRIVAVRTIATRFENYSSVTDARFSVVFQRGSGEARRLYTLSRRATLKVHDEFERST